MKVPSAKKLPSGQWRCQIQVGGKRYSVTDATKRGAERLAAGIKAGYVEGQRKADSISLCDAITAYLEARRHILSPSTLRGYQTIQRHFFPALMPMDIYHLSQKAVQIAVNDASRNHSAKTVRNAYGLVHAVLSFYGVELGAVQLPQLRRQDRHWLQSDEITVLLREIDGDRCELPILLAVWLGMRRSEILGLCWDSVDLERGLLTVRRSYVYAGSGRWVLKETTKTAASQRVIHLPAYIVERFRRITPGSPDQRVFSGFDPGLPRKRLQRACQRAGITVTHLHGLRHTFAAVMLREGVNERIVMRQGGWSSNRTMREIYDYIMDDDAVQAQKLRDSFFNPDQFAHENAHGQSKT